MIPTNTPLKQEISIKWHVEKSNDAPKLKNHSCIVTDENLIIFGGFDGRTNVSTLYFFHIHSCTWKVVQSTGDIPRARNGHSATLVGNKMYIIGGWLGIGPYASDEIYALNLDTMNWSEIIFEDGQTIGPSNMHTANYYRGKIIVFRGGNGVDYLNDLIYINVSAKKYFKIHESFGKGPSPRANHGATVVGSNLFLFGGWNGLHRLNDLYVLNIDSVVWTKVDYNELDFIPKKRAGIPLSNYKNEYLILFGGSCVNSVYLNDVLFYDLTNNKWIQVTNIQGVQDCPKERAGHTAVIKKRYLYIFGGGNVGNSYYNEMTIMEINPPPKADVKPYLSSEANLLKSVSMLFDNPLLSDIAVIVGDKKIYCHFCIIVHLSGTFWHIYLYSYTGEKFSIEISNFKYENVRYVIRYLYTGIIETDISELSDMLEILALSDIYKISEIKDYYQVKLSKSVSVDTYSQIIFSAKSSGSHSLYRFCKWFYRQNRDKLGIAELTEREDNDIY